MIPGLPSVGGLELIIILLIVLLFFGASRLPQMGRSLGHGIKEFRKGISGSAQEEDEVRDRKEEEEPSLNGAAARKEGLSDAEKEDAEETARVASSTEQKKT
jgi:sec-independent protein translocase protein TatA